MFRGFKNYEIDIWVTDGMDVLFLDLKYILKTIAMPIAIINFILEERFEKDILFVKIFDNFFKS